MIQYVYPDGSTSSNRPMDGEVFSWFAPDGSLEVWKYELATGTWSISGPTSAPSKQTSHKGYPGIDSIKLKIKLEDVQVKKCSCDFRELMMQGCKCGGI